MQRPGQATWTGAIAASFLAQPVIAVQAQLDVGVITPWNHPLAVSAMDVIPALVAGRFSFPARAANSRRSPVRSCCSPGC
ncbi:aldehyde dehydrogenase family protein [Cryobacterium psychrophilum]|uniref:Aldehyde dehydrogenase family protein n=1 Tax=Cryobacterium psychrophilum TaxID=41988 RepID=A0A4Y8KUH3_9MICO|nr:aldehyde dehydrogenase family protein [Cryobacterium psychrophilum]